MKIEELLKGVKYVMPAVDQVQLVAENSDLITFSQDGLRTFDGTLFMFYPIETELDCSVKGKPLGDILSRIGGGNVRLSIEEEKNGQFFLKGPGKKLKLPVIERNMDQFFLDEDLDFQKLPDDFMEGLSLCVYTASKDVTMGVLQGIYVDGNEMFASDNYRIGNYLMKDSIGAKFIIGRNHVEVLLKIGNFTEFSLDKSWIHFRGQNGERVGCRLIEGEYKFEQLRKIMDVKEKGQYEFPDNLGDLIHRAGVFSLQDSSQMWYVKLYREKDQLVVEGISEDGEYEERLAWDSDFPDDISLEMDPNFVLKLLGITKSFVLSDDGKFAVFTKGNEFRHLEMILRDK